VGSARLADADLDKKSLQIKSHFFALQKHVFLFSYIVKAQLSLCVETKKAIHFVKDFLFVGAARFELTTSCSQSRRDTGLRYAPISQKI